MATRRFIVTGGYTAPKDSEPTGPELFVEFKTPGDFEEYVYRQLLSKELLKVLATPQQDDLSKKRSPATPQEFVFRVKETHQFGDFFIHVADENGKWIRIDTTDEVFFDLFE